MGVPSFSERLERRTRVWWGKPRKWRNRESYRRLFHRLQENHSLLSKDDPEARWHCCDLWQRLLSNKWNAREFVQRYGCRVPALYWYGRRPGTLPIDLLPDHFVIRPIWGASTRGTYVFAQDRNLLDQTPLTKASLRDHLVRTAGRVRRFPIMAEEFVKTESGRYELPTEYKCYMFGDTVGAVHVVLRSGRDKAKIRPYTAAWEPFDDPINTHHPLAPLVDPPRCLDELIACAKRLGTAYGTFVRVDLYASDMGCVFGEFSSTPMEGRCFTPFAEQYFGQLWQRTFPDRT
jgi:hypothetical protein